MKNHLPNTANGRRVKIPKGTEQETGLTIDQTDKPSSGESEENAAQK